MGSNNEYRGLIFTNHALSRMGDRRITQEQIWETYTKPDLQDEKRNDATERKKKFGSSEISIIFKHGKQNEVVIISCWVEPPVPGSRDAHEKAWWESYKKAGFWGKLWLTLIKQIGLS